MAKFQQVYLNQNFVLDKMDESGQYNAVLRHALSCAFCMLRTKPSCL